MSYYSFSGDLVQVDLDGKLKVAVDAGGGAQSDEMHSHEVTENQHIETNDSSIRRRKSTTLSKMSRKIHTVCIHVSVC